MAGGLINWLVTGVRWQFAKACYWLRILRPWMLLIVAVGAVMAGLRHLQFSDQLLASLAVVLLTLGANSIAQKRKNAGECVYVIDRVLSELSRNRVVFDMAVQQKGLVLTQSFATGAWYDLRERVTLLPRDLYTRLSVLYDELEQANAQANLVNLRINLEVGLSGIQEDLYQHRKALRTWYEVRLLREDWEAKQELKHRGEKRVSSAE